LQNEQCGLCWDLEFDKLGKKTHEDITKHYHDFVPLDYCNLCKEPKFDQYGFQTHTPEICAIEEIQKKRKDHKFISGIETKYNQKKKKRIFKYLGICLIGVVSTFGTMNLIF